MTNYRVIYEQARDGNWSASAADLPVFSVGATRAEAEREIREAIAIYFDELASQHLPPGAVIGTVTV